MAKISIYGIEIDETCASYLNIVVKLASSGDSDDRETRRRALRNLGRNGCRDALFYLIEKYSSSGDSDERKVRRTAFEYLERLDSGEDI